MDEPLEFEDFVREHYQQMLHVAVLLSGDHVSAEDLAQEALVKIWLRWSRISRLANPRAYGFRILVRVHLSWRRRHWHGEVPTREVPDSTTAVDAQDRLIIRSLVLDCLAQLPPRQRAVLVLRYYADLTEEQTAAVLGCTRGTVKSQAFKALAALRVAFPVPV